MKSIFDEILAGLMDWGFEKLVTPVIIRAVYVLGWILAGLMAIQYIVVGFRANEVIGVVHIFLSLLVFIFYVLVLRVILEILMALFRGATSSVKPTPPPAPPAQEKKAEQETIDVPSVPNE